MSSGVLTGASLTAVTSPYSVVSRSRMGRPSRPTNWSPEGQQSPRRPRADAGRLNPPNATLKSVRNAFARRCRSAVRHLAGPVDVVGEHRRVEAVDGVVGDPHRVSACPAPGSRYTGPRSHPARSPMSCPRAEHAAVEPAPSRSLTSAAGQSEAVGDAPGDTPTRSRRPLATSGPIWVARRTGRPPDLGGPGQGLEKPRLAPSTTILVNEEQTWPDRKTRPGMVCAAVAMSMSSRITAADCRRVPGHGRSAAADRGDPPPGRVDPVKVILSARGSRTSSPDTSRSAVSTLSTPAAARPPRPPRRSGNPRRAPPARTSR